MIRISMAFGAATLFLAVGCTMKRSTSPAPAAAAAPAKEAAALPVQLPAGWEAVAHGDKTTLVPKRAFCHIQLWTVADAAAPADVLPRIAKLIDSEVRDFKATSTEDLTIGGRPAKHVFGKGVEADDGDDSNAEVFLFTAGGRVRMVCAHGEGDGVVDQRKEILAILATAK